MPRQGSLLSCWDVFFSRACLVHNCSADEKLKFKRGEDVLEEVEKFCYLGDIISFGGVSEATCRARKKFRDLNDVLVGKQFIFEATGEDLSVLLDQFCCAVVKHGNLLFWRR